ncbi:hypothetical protein [Spiroplasma endosymbiont of Aspidapion aeneum]|uniref:hypothetical protein n=1 Tax=Spiroplasma endosymbiont of Aspidapion aeneum TaxID=3066276 RepID=UPI00313E5081
MGKKIPTKYIDKRIQEIEDSYNLLNRDKDVNIIRPKRPLFNNNEPQETYKPREFVEPIVNHEEIDTERNEDQLIDDKLSPNDNFFRNAENSNFAKEQNIPDNYNIIRPRKKDELEIKSPEIFEPRKESTINIFKSDDEKEIFHKTLVEKNKQYNINIEEDQNALKILKPIEKKFNRIIKKTEKKIDSLLKESESLEDIDINKSIHIQKEFLKAKKELDVKVNKFSNHVNELQKQKLKSRWENYKLSSKVADFMLLRASDLDRGNK